MRTILSSLLLYVGVLLSQTGFGQELYYIVEVKGNIVANGSLLAKGKQIKATDKLKISPGAKAIVMSSQRGRFVIPKPGVNTSSQLEFFVKDVLSPLKTNAQASTRGGEEANGVIDLSNYFGRQQFLIIGETLNFDLDPNKYPLDNKSYLLLMAKVDGVTYLHKLPHTDKHVTLTKDAMLEARGGERIALTALEQVELYYIKNNARQLVTSFKPVFLPEAEVKDFFDFLSKTTAFGELSEAQAKYDLLYWSFVAAYLQDFVETATASESNMAAPEMKIVAKFGEESFKNWLHIHKYIPTAKVDTPKDVVE
jgi:hypothetical protein